MTNIITRWLIAYALGCLALGAQGYRGFFGLAKETTWGTAIAATDYIELLSESLTTGIDRFPTRNIFNGWYEPDDYAGLRRSAGGIVHAGHPLSVGFLLKAAFTNNSISTVLSGFLYRNTYTGVKSEFADGVPRQPYTLEVFRDINSSHQYAGAMLNRLELALAPNQDLRCTAEWLARSQLMIAATTPTFPASSTDPFAFDTASVQLAGAANTRVEALSISIENQLEGIPTLNNASTIARVRTTGPQMIRIRGTLDFPDFTEQQDFINQTERALSLNIFKSNSFNLLVEVPRMVYSAFPVGMPGRGRLTVAFEGMARYLSSSAAAIMMVISNTKSNY